MFSPLFQAVQAGEVDRLGTVLRQLSEQAESTSGWACLNLGQLFSLTKKKGSVSQRELLLSLAANADAHLIEAGQAAAPVIGRSTDVSSPLFSGSVAKYIEQSSGNDTKEVYRQLHNIVRQCQHCGKSNGYSLQYCNACSAPISHLPVSRTTNVFGAFVFGVAGEEREWFVSIRHQDESFLVFDDILAMSSCHLNCIPTDQYLPDFRVLFAYPHQAQELVQQMKSRLHDSIWKHFWSVKEWRTHQQCEGSDRATFDQLMSHLCSGFNFPPSQYQLHLHGLLPPFTPEHHRLFVRGKHFVKGRWFPLSYIERSLQALIDSDETIEQAAQMEVADLIGRLSEFGVHYDQEYEENWRQYQQSQAQLWSWNPKNFGALLFKEKQMLSLKCKQSTILNAEQRLQYLKSDKLRMQNWGRPHIEGRPSGTFYRFPKPAPLPCWPKRKT